MVGHKPKTALKARLPPMQWTLLGPQKNNAPDFCQSKNTQSPHQTLTMPFHNFHTHETGITFQLLSSKGAMNIGILKRQ